jgi:CheY-like chemotaxis protein
MSGTILLADDSLTIQKVVELTFADTDYRVVAVSSGDELVDRLADSAPDLIICDVIMPGKDGYEVCQQIKSSPEWLHLPVILLTGTFEPFDRDRAIAAGCSEIITKPFEARKLVDTVERLIGDSGHQQPAATADAESTSPVEPPTEPPAPPPADTSPVDEPGGEAVEEFGTQLSEAPPAEPVPAATPETAAEPAAAAQPEAVAEAAPDDDEIEFTTSGFAEMEAAGAAQDAVPADSGRDGIEYELGEDAQEAAPPEVPDLSAQTVRIEIPPEGTQTPAADEAPDEASDEAPDETPGEPQQAAEPVPATEAEPIEEPVEAATDEPARDETPGADKPEFEDESSKADTSPVEPPPAEESTGPVAPPAESAGLSEDDIDRIARRVLELASDRLDQIAWEVVPDMAEIVVRQRVRELEAEAEGVATDTVQ